MQMARCPVEVPGTMPIEVADLGLRGWYRWPALARSSACYVVSSGLRSIGLCGPGRMTFSVWDSLSVIETEVAEKE